MKTEMAMLPNGNYERVVSPSQHKCRSENFIYTCYEYGWDLGKLYLRLEDGDPCEDGYSSTIEVNYCPFCGYKPEKLRVQDSNLRPMD